MSTWISYENPDGENYFRFDTDEDLGDERVDWLHDTFWPAFGEALESVAKTCGLELVWSDWSDGPEQVIEDDDGELRYYKLKVELAEQQIARVEQDRDQCRAEAARAIAELDQLRGGES